LHWAWTIQQVRQNRTKDRRLNWSRT
jgi:hypothetical protein